MIKSYEDIQGWFDFQDVYSFMVNKAPSDRTVYFCEVGCWLGKSTAYLASLIKNHKTNIQLHVIDNFEGDGTTDFQSEIVKNSGGSIFDQFYQNMSDLGLMGHIVPHKSISWEGVKLLPDVKFDFIYIDADHKYDSVKKDMAAFWPKVSNGGVMAGHDFTGETETAVKEFALENGLELFRSNMSWIIQKHDQTTIQANS